MTVLSRAALTSGAIAARHADPSPRPIEILQIGEGVLMRGFIDWMVDVANEKGVYGGGVAVAAPVATSGRRRFMRRTGSIPSCSAAARTAPTSRSAASSRPFKQRSILTRNGARCCGSRSRPR